MHTDRRKRRSFLASLSSAGDVKRSSPYPTHLRRDPTLIGSPPRIPSCSSCPSWFPLFFTATVTRPQVVRPQSPARRADSPPPMNELPDVACVPASSRKGPTVGGGQFDAEIVIRDQRLDIGRPSRYDSRVGGGRPNAASDRTRRETKSGKGDPCGPPSPHHLTCGSASGGSTKRSKFRPE